jgi:tetratricopeptide (TPR) repeat protein
LNARAFLARENLLFEEAFDYFSQARLAAEDAGYWGGVYYTLYMEINLDWELGLFDRALEAARQIQAVAQTHNNYHRLYVSIALAEISQTLSGHFSDAVDTGKQLLRQIQNPKGTPIPIMWGARPHPLAFLHSGYLDEVMTMPDTFGGAESRAWVLLARGRFTEAYERTRQFHSASKPGDYKTQPILDAVLAVALQGLGRKREAVAYLSQGIRISLAKHTILPLLRLLPAAAWILADSPDEDQRVYGLEVWGTARTIPFVANSNFYSDLIGARMDQTAAGLPPDAAAAALEKGGKQELWPAAETLLSKLDALAASFPA